MSPERKSHPANGQRQHVRRFIAAALKLTRTQKHAARVTMKATETTQRETRIGSGVCCVHTAHHINQR